MKLFFEPFLFRLRSKGIKCTVARRNISKSRYGQDYCDGISFKRGNKLVQLAFDEGTGLLKQNEIVEYKKEKINSMQKLLDFITGNRKQHKFETTRKFKYSPEKTEIDSHTIKYEQGATSPADGKQVRAVETEIEYKDGKAVTASTKHYADRRWW